MQDPNEDTEWNDLLRQKGILPPKEPEISEDQIADMIEQTVQEKQSVGGRLHKLNLEQLDELEDDEDEAIILEYRRKRIAEMKAQAAVNKFGEVGEITGQDYVEKVTNAGKGIWVILHLYKPGIPLCTLINQYLPWLAAKYPQVKFLKAISTTCIPNFLDYNLPTFFIYHEGQMRSQLVGAQEFGGGKLSLEELEWILSRTKAYETDLEEDPRKTKAANSVMEIRGRRKSESDEDDW